MNGKKERQYYCCICRRLTGTLHEVVNGNGNRMISIEYNIQVPICAICHSMAHGPNIKSYRTFFLKDVLKIDPVKAVVAVHSKAARGYLEEVKDHCKNQILKYEL